MWEGAQDKEHCKQRCLDSVYCKSMDWLPGISGTYRYCRLNVVNEDDVPLNNPKNSKEAKYFRKICGKHNWHLICLFADIIIILFSV